MVRAGGPRRGYRWRTGCGYPAPEVEGHRQRGTLARTHDGFTLYLAKGACHFQEVLPDTGEADAGSAPGRRPGRSHERHHRGACWSKWAARLRPDTPLLVMEAMKMEHTIRAPPRGSGATPSTTSPVTWWTAVPSCSTSPPPRSRRDEHCHDASPSSRSGPRDGLQNESGIIPLAAKLS